MNSASLFLNLFGASTFNMQKIFNLNSSQSTAILSKLVVRNSNLLLVKRGYHFESWDCASRRFIN